MKDKERLLGFIWKIANILRGDFRKDEYRKVIIPFVILRRFDCILKEKKQLKQTSYTQIDNSTELDLALIVKNKDECFGLLLDYLKGFSGITEDILNNFNLIDQINRLQQSRLLFIVLQNLCNLDLSPKNISSEQMSTLLEEVNRKTSFLSGDLHGEYYTPKDVISLMLKLLVCEDQTIAKKNIEKSVFDCCSGTGNTLLMAHDYFKSLNPSINLRLFGQEINAESYAFCKAAMLLKGTYSDNIVLGNSLTNPDLTTSKSDNFFPNEFDYFITNPPYGMQWKKIEPLVKEEHERQGFSGRYGPGLPSVKDASLLFLMNIMSKMKKEGSRIAIIFNGSPLFAGRPGPKKNENSIRQWILENDYLDSIVELPNWLFYSTGITTYLWILSNKKDTKRKGSVQLINASTFFVKMNKTIGNKRNRLESSHITRIENIYKSYSENEYSKILNNSAFGYKKITVERPQRKNSQIVLNKKGDPKPDINLRDTENIPLNRDSMKHLEEQIHPHFPDAWIDEDKTRIGYEIPFAQYFFNPKPLRTLTEINKDILALQKEIDNLSIL